MIIQTVFIVIKMFAFNVNPASISQVAYVLHVLMKVAKFVQVDLL